MPGRRLRRPGDELPAGVLARWGLQRSGDDGHGVGRGRTTLQFLSVRAGHDGAEVRACATQGQVRIYHRDTGRLAENLNSGVAAYTFRLAPETGSARWLVEHVVVRTASACS